MSSLLSRQLTSQIEKETPPKAVAIFGPRRIGKTTMLEQIVSNQNARWYIGDSPFIAKELQFKSLGDIKNALLHYSTIVIDEAHKIPDIGNTVKMLVDVNEHLENPARIFLTSSSPFYLSSIKESALGRVVSRQMWPFSIQEIAQYAGWGQVMNSIDQLMVYGTMPNVYLDADRGRAFLEDYCEGLLLKDLIEQNPIRKLDKFRVLVQLLAYYVGSEVNYDSLARECGLNRLTVEEYIAKLQQASIVKVCSSYAKNLPNEMKKGKKIYFFDNGIRNALIHNFAPMAQRDDAGALWENFFFMERVKLHDTLRDFTQIYFWRTTGNFPSEIDFVEVQDQKITAFECKLSDKVTNSRGQNSFLNAYPGSSVEIVHPNDCLKIFG